MRKHLSAIHSSTAQPGLETWFFGLGLDTDATTTLEQRTLDQLDRRAFWRLCWRMAASEPERVVLYEVFGLALPPRKVRERHPDLFGDVTAVYAAKRRLMERLRRNPTVRALRDA